MQRHLALLLFLFPLPKRRVKEDLDVSVYLDRAKQQMAEMHARHRARAVQAITQKNNLLNQVEDLKRTLVRLDEKIAMAGSEELAEKFRREKREYEQSLVTAEEILAQAEETAEQIKVAIQREEELIRQQTADVLALKAKWGQADIQLEMERELRRIGVWQLAVPPQPEIDRKTARELIGFLLVLVIALLVWR